MVYVCTPFKSTIFRHVVRFENGSRSFSASQLLSFCKMRAADTLVNGY